MTDQVAVDRAALYDSLARYEWLRRRVRRAKDGEALELHKALRAPRDAAGPDAGKGGLHAWMWQRLDVPPAARVLDVGCGFGATILSFARAHADADTRLVGLGVNPYQIRRAREQARALGLDARCEFREQSYDAPIEGAFDRVVSVEALLHADDLGRTLAGVARAMRPGARLLAVEDAVVDDAEHGDADLALLRRAWFAERLYAVADWRAAVESAGLVWQGCEDLSAQVPARDAAVLARGERRLRRLRRFAPSRKLRGIADAFLGGVALERLYARGLLRYLAMDIRKPHA